MDLETVEEKSELQKKPSIIKTVGRKKSTKSITIVDDIQYHESNPTVLSEVLEDLTTVSVSVQASPIPDAIARAIDEVLEQIELLDKNKNEIKNLLNVQRNKIIEKLRHGKPTDALYTELEKIDQNIEHIMKQHDVKKGIIEALRDRAMELMRLYEIRKPGVIAEMQRVLENIATEKEKAADLIVVKRAYVEQLINMIATLQEKVDHLDQMIFENRLKFEMKIKELNRMILERAGRTGQSEVELSTSLEQLNGMKKDQVLQFDDLIKSLIREKEDLTTEALLKRQEINEAMSGPFRISEIPEDIPFEIIVEHKTSGSMNTKIGSTPNLSLIQNLSDLDSSDSEEDEERNDRLDELKKSIGKELIHALAEIVAKNPENQDPIHYLSQWLYAYAKHEAERVEREKDEVELMMERERLRKERLFDDVKSVLWMSVEDKINVIIKKVLLDEVEDEASLSYESTKSVKPVPTSKIRFNPVVDFQETMSN